MSSIRNRIAQACKTADRAPDEVTLLAVSKRQSVKAISALYALGQTEFGENYTDEALEKQRLLSQLHIQWHYIGPLQSNKTRAVATHFDWVQSVDRSKLVDRLARQRPTDRPPLNILLQVNIDEEPQKSGVDPQQLQQLAHQVAQNQQLALRGLMAIPKPAADGQSDAFLRMRSLFEQLQAQYPQIDTLSMGMSQDLEAAIVAGSTMVRVGTALMGPRGQ